MIVEVPVIGALALHVLFYVKEGSFSLFELPVKQLQFSPCPFHSIPASIHLDLAGFGKCEPGFAEPERLCKRDPIGKYFIRWPKAITPGLFSFQPLCFAALEPCFMPFLACHNKSIRPLYKCVVGCRLKCFALTHEMG